MISDVLFDVETCLVEAEKSIGAYLEDDATRRCYQEREILAEIVDVLGRVRALRRKLDNPLALLPVPTNIQHSPSDPDARLNPDPGAPTVTWKQFLAPLRACLAGEQPPPAPGAVDIRDHYLAEIRRTHAELKADLSSDARSTHPDARRLDFLERHRLDLVCTAHGAWVVSDEFGAILAEDWATPRGAIDAAAEAIEGEEE